MPSSTKPASGKEEEKFPVILTPWIRTYRAFPKLCIPYTNLDFAYTFGGTALLICLRLLSDQIYTKIFGWPVGAKMTTEAAACSVSGLQATFFVPSLAACLLSQPYRPSARMESAPQWWQDAAKALIQFCTGYMFYDSIMLCVDTWVPGSGPALAASDLMFIGHHIATTLYMCTALLQGAGHMSAMMLMFLGEMTSPLMNSHSVLRFAVKHHTSTLIHDLLMYSEFLFAIVYIPTRSLLGPLAAAHLTYDLLFTKVGRQNVSVWLSLLWMPMCWGVLFGSISWIQESIEMVQDGLEVKYGVDYDYGDQYVHHHTDL